MPLTEYWETDAELVKSSALFDANYYLTQNPDVAAAGVDPVEHYLHYGAAEGREPSIQFSGSAYQQLYPDVLLSGVNPLVHFLRYGEPAGRTLEVRFAGWQAPALGPVVLLVGHAAGPVLFGGERSLLDVLKGLNLLGYRVVVTLPQAVNSEYIANLRPYCREVVVFPYIWWQANRPVQLPVVQRFKQLLQQHQVQLLHANTLVLSEPLAAARELGVKVAVHVRELPALDPALCVALDATPEQILAQLQQQADLVIANSEFTASQYPGCRQLAVVRNTIDAEHFATLQLAELQPGQELRLALISSNSAKKGLADFVELAKWLAQQQLPVRCILIGPDNDEKQALLQQQQQGLLPVSLELAEYCADPLDALRQADVVLNLSHFQESFGRSVLEGMAAGRLVIAYRWGALPELIQHGETGFLLPFADIDGVGQLLAQLLANPARVQQVAASGRAFSRQQFSLETFSRQLADAYRLLKL